MPGKNAPTYRMKGFSGFGNDNKPVDGVPNNNNISLKNRKEGFNTVKTNKDGSKSLTKKLTDKEVLEYRKNNPNKRNNKLTPKQKAVKGGMPLEVAEEIGIPRSGIKKGFLGKVGKVLGAGVLSGLPRYGNHSKGMPKTYKEAYKTRGKKYQDMGEAEYIKEAKAQNLKKYGTTKPSSDKSLSKEKKTELKTQQTTQAKKDATGKDKKRNETARVKKATVTEKKTIGPKNRVTVKAAKASKKAKIKDAKQKGYETRKDKRAAVSDARKSGRAGVKEARKNKRDLKKAEKNTRKNDKKVVKAAISDAKTAAKNDKKAPLAKYKNAAHRKAAHASMNEKKKK